MIGPRRLEGKAGASRSDGLFVFDVSIEEHPCLALLSGLFGLMRVDKANKNPQIKEAIRNIMQLPAIEKAQEDLNTIVGEYRAQIKQQGSVQVQELSAKLDNWLGKKTQYLERQTAVREELPALRVQILDLEEKSSKAQPSWGLRLFF